MGTCFDGISKNDYDIKTIQFIKNGQIKNLLQKIYIIKPIIIPE